MEIRRYLQILGRWWWVAAVAFITVAAGSVIFTFVLPPRYKASATLVVSPTASMASIRDVRDSLNTLDKPSIANTYAEIAQSDTIWEKAWADIGLSPEKTFSVHSEVLYKTNIIVISVEGPDPEVARDLATAIADRTMEYVSTLYEIYDLKLLDSPRLPRSPISPNKKLNLALGIVLGLGFGGTAAFIADYLQASGSGAEFSSILDSKSGAYKRSFFLRRLREEMSRSRRSKRPLALGVLRVDNLDEVASFYRPEVRDMALRQLVLFLRQHLPEEDLIARLDSGLFALLLLDSTGEEAMAMLERLRTRVEWTLFEIEQVGVKLNLMASFGLAAYDYNGTGPEKLMERAILSLDGGADGGGNEISFGGGQRGG